MKTLFLFLLAVLSAAAAETDTYTYNSKDGSGTSWVFEHYRVEGLAMPKDGDKFKFTDLFEVIHQGQKVQLMDLIVFQDGADTNLGVIVDMGKPDDDIIMVKEPCVSDGKAILGLSQVSQTSIKNIRYCFRPKKASVPAPSREEYNADPPVPKGAI